MEQPDFPNSFPTIFIQGLGRKKHGSIRAFTWSILFFVQAFPYLAQIKPKISSYKNLMIAFHPRAMKHSTTNVFVQVIVNGMRVRIKLDEARLTELIQGMDASAVPGLLRHLGDVASLSFAPYQNGDSPLLILHRLLQFALAYVSPQRNSLPSRFDYCRSINFKFVSLRTRQVSWWQSPVSHKEFFNV